VHQGLCSHVQSHKSALPFPQIINNFRMAGRTRRPDDLHCRGQRRASRGTEVGAGAQLFHVLKGTIGVCLICCISCLLKLDNLQIETLGHIKLVLHTAFSAVSQHRNIPPLSPAVFCLGGHLTGLHKAQGTFRIPAPVYKHSTFHCVARHHRHHMGRYAGQQGRYSRSLARVTQLHLYRGANA